ncbi:MAG: aminoacyl-tRNA hydrolase [Gemmatimonadetes bacterium]|nr:aminoacyl-tRNA hydrolase [Gemmatimonadota bacterium]
MPHWANSGGLRYVLTVRYIVPQAELEFRASRAGGPGGQHVNKASTRIEALWNVAQSPSLDETRRERILERLGGRIDTAGVRHVVAAERRSQLRNRRAAAARLQALVDGALHQPKARRPTKVPRAVKERRLVAKRRRGDAKKLRGRPREED